jgi:putative spermidine/putrescine transport system permease protein
MSAPAHGVTARPVVGWQVSPSWRVGALLAAPAVLAVAALIGVPLVTLVTDTLTQAGAAAYADLLASPADRAALLRTVWVSALVALLATALGAVLAWALCTVENRVWRGLLWISVLAPFWMSVVIKNYTFVLLLRQGGPVHDVLATVGLIATGDDLLYTEGAVVVGMLYAMLPYAVLPLYATFSALDRALVAAAETLGARRALAVLTVVVPTCARGILNAATLVFVICLGFYVTPVVLGGPSAPFVATVIGDDVFEYFDLAGAKAFAVLLLAVALVALALSQLVARLLPSTGVER